MVILLKVACVLFALRLFNFNVLQSYNELCLDSSALIVKIEVDGAALIEHVFCFNVLLVGECVCVLIFRPKARKAQYVQGSKALFRLEEYRPIFRVGLSSRHSSKYVWDLSTTKLLGLITQQNCVTPFPFCPIFSFIAGRANICRTSESD